MGRAKVVCLKIGVFRRFQNITIPFGNHVTIIAGQNGTSKSTLLGMLAQPFSFGVVRGSTAGKSDASSYTGNYHGIKLHELKDLTGKPFMYDCDDVFRLSTEFDFGNKYQYETELLLSSGIGSNLPNNSLLTKSRDRKTKERVIGMRFVTGPGASHESGEGNFPHPVIYLGLNRLWPLAVTNKCTFSDDALSDENRNWYVKKYNEILCLDEHGNNAKFMDTAEKGRSISPHSSNYDGESCSAGQDNLSQLLTAILSFRGLKKKLGDQYLGGILLIDELDATLHAFAQDKLLELLCDVSNELELQIIATSHSLRLLEKAYKSSLKNNVNFLYLVNEDGRITNRKWTYQEISNHLKVEATPPAKKKPRKVSVVFEDDEGMFLFKQICGSKLRNYISCANTASLGAGQLKNLADMSKSLAELQDMIFVPDGDMANAWTNPPKNLLALPGGKRPETLVYRHLFLVRDSNPFWKKCGNAYTRQFAITKQGGDSMEKGEDKEWVKKWYKEQSCYWGRGNHKIFKSWIDAHKTECLRFCEKFIKLLNGRYRGKIPKDVINKVLVEFKDS